MKKIFFRFIYFILFLICMFFAYQYYKYGDKICIYSCPKNCEIGDYNGHIIEVKYLNQLLTPIFFKKEKILADKKLKNYEDFSDKLDINPKSEIGSWEMETCIIQYSKYGFIEKIYILGDKGYYFYEVNKISCTCHTKLEVKDLIE